MQRAAEASDATAARHKFTPRYGDLGLAPELHRFPIHFVQRRYQSVMPDRQTIAQRHRVASRHGRGAHVCRSCRMHVTAIERLLCRSDRGTIVIVLRQRRRHFAPYGIANTGRRRPISRRQQRDHTIQDVGCGHFGLVLVNDLGAELTQGPVAIAMSCSDCPL